jgi:hypothetical protein
LLPVPHLRRSVFVGILTQALRPGLCLAAQPAGPLRFVVGKDVRLFQRESLDFYPEIIRGEFQPSLRDYSVLLYPTQDFILGYFQSSLRDCFLCLAGWGGDVCCGCFNHRAGRNEKSNLHRCAFQPSLRDYSVLLYPTQDFILGYFQSSLRDWFPFFADCGGDAYCRCFNDRAGRKWKI